jgi:hypothetical protein
VNGGELGCKFKLRVYGGVQLEWEMDFCQKNLFSMLSAHEGSNLLA